MLEHFFVSQTDGSLHDTRRKDWSSKPLRQHFKYTFARIENTAQLRATLRAGDVAWPGGYPMFFITSDGGALHFQCVKENLRCVLESVRTKTDDGWRVLATEINYEDSKLYCDQCSERIESAYIE